MNLGDLNKVWEVKPLKKPGSDEARKILERVAKQVQPIMRKHNWRVKLLSEFCPTNPALLGLNFGGGIEVKLRLRRPNRDWDFIPFHQILDTMLHELCHNAHGPHNAAFYKLWDEIRKECEELMAKGITGTSAGFDLPGRRLGGFSHQPPVSSLRQAALAAAEKRAGLGSLLPSGPKRLGGDSTIMDALSPVQAAAMAAERRLQDDIWCGSQSFDTFDSGGNSSDLSDNNVYGEQSNGRSTHDSGRGAVDLVVISRKRSHETGSSSVDLSKQASASRPLISHDATHNTKESIMWECGFCTLLNPPLAPLCKLCSSEKPKDVAIKYKFWSCKFCTLENGIQADKCGACGQWRYSHGPFVSPHAPNLGT